jgi:hypothetical protein
MEAEPVCQDGILMYQISATRAKSVDMQIQDRLRQASKLENPKILIAGTTPDSPSP